MQGCMDAWRVGGNKHRVGRHDLVVQARDVVDVVCPVQILHPHIHRARRDVDCDVILVHVSHTVQEHLCVARMGAEGRRLVRD